MPEIVADGDMQLPRTTDTVKLFARIVVHAPRYLQWKETDADAGATATLTELVQIIATAATRRRFYADRSLLWALTGRRQRTATARALESRG